MIYLDHAAATPLSAEALAVMTPYFREAFYNPSASYLAAQSVAADVKRARADCARVLGVQPHEVVFTAGGTEANNLAIQGIMTAFEGARCLVSAIEHASVLEPAEKYNYALIPVTKRGMVEVEALKALIDDATVLVSVMLANNEVGTLQPITAIGCLLDDVRNDRQRRGVTMPLYFHTDACQAGLYLDLHMSRLGVDLMTINGGKIYGPKQSGLLAVRSHVVLAPQVLGGGQERGKRSGTENVPSIIGLAYALTDAQKRHKQSCRSVTDVRDRFIEQILHMVPGATLNGHPHNRLANNIHLTFAGKDNERLMMELDERGIQCAVGSACHASSDAPSHVLLAMGMSEAEAQSSLRFSLGRETRPQDIDTVVAALVALS